MENRPHFKFIAFVHLLDALCSTGLMNRDPDNPNNVLIFRENALADGYDAPVSGFFSENIFSVAQELFDDPGQRSDFFATLSGRGYNVVFSKDGQFEHLVKS